MRPGSTASAREIEAPLLVSNAVDVLYLTGLHSSNAVLLVEPDGARLFTDFRYVEKARELGIEAVDGTPRTSTRGSASTSAAGSSSRRSR